MVSFLLMTMNSCEYHIHDGRLSKTCQLFLVVSVQDGIIFKDGLGNVFNLVKQSHWSLFLEGSPHGGQVDVVGEEKKQSDNHEDGNHEAAELQDVSRGAVGGGGVLAGLGRSVGGLLRGSVPGVFLKSASRDCDQHS